MKKIILTAIVLLSFAVTNAQSDKAIAKLYIKRAETARESLDFKVAKKNFEKALERLDTIVDRNIAYLGANIYFDLHQKQPSLKEQLDYLNKTEYYLKMYFNIYKKTNTEEYLERTEFSIVLQETKEELNKRIEAEELERLRKEKELRRIDSLKTVWQNKSESLSIDVDSIYTFNKYNVALFTKNNAFGIMSDTGEVLVEASGYQDALQFDGYIILKNTKEDPTKIYSFNTSTKSGFLLPNVSDFNPLSTHYGQVMLPRENGRLVTYPNNSYEPFVYDLNVKKVVRIANEKELLKSLKKGDKIDKYNKDGEVKVNKNWYRFGGHIGGGIHPLYSEDSYNLHSYLFSIDGTIKMAASEYKYIGAFHNSKVQAIYNGEIYWLNQNGTKVGDAKSSDRGYTGKSKIKKLENGKYQFMRGDIIILRNEKLEKMADFLRNNSK